MERIAEAAASERGGAGRTAACPALGEALSSLRQALEAKDFEAVDASLDGLKALPLQGEALAAVSQIEDCILIADVQQALKALANLQAK
jgi:hypothetical protein